jgi:3-methyl-2-oxobutanoate hydroxymethyltransferase
VEKKLKSPLKNIKRRNSSDGTLGLTLQSIYKFGLTLLKEEEEAHKPIEDAKLLERLGCLH